MLSESGPPTMRRTWTLLLGPSLSLTECLTVLEALAQTRVHAPAALEQLEDWSDLFACLEEVGQLLVDADQLGLEQVGLIRAFLKRYPGWDLTLCGKDANGRAQRELLCLPQVRWIPAPLDMDSLARLLESPSLLVAGATGEPTTRVENGDAAGNIPQGYVTRSAASVAPRPAVAPQPRGSLEAYEIPRAETEVRKAPQGIEDGTTIDHETEQQLLDEVDRILVGRSQPTGMTAVATAPKVAPVPTRMEPATTGEASYDSLVALEEALGELQSPAPDTLPAPQALAPSQPETLPTEAFPTAPAPRPASPAPYFKHQVADLADIVQCVDMGLDQAVEDVLEAEGPGATRLAARFEQLSSEVARLRQYTRTLSFMAAPPSHGEQRFDLGPMLEEMLTMRRGEEDAPRYLIRVPDAMPLRSDKLLLMQAFDALLFLCHACSGPQGTVRVDGLVNEDDGDCANGSDNVQVSIRFPAGRLAELEPHEILQPYALRRSLPELGPNSLAAAAGILRGQGGSIELRKEPRGGLEWLIRMPRCED